jgi:hypothetical protein
MLAQTVTYSYSTSGGLPGWFWPVYSIVLILMIASIWMVFSKANQPGWAAIIPLASHDPRPYTRVASSDEGMKGGTVSM